ncbi:MAG: response regulator [Actinomycetota bacterium]|nr:response regulator [Actinomycetota bacterium]
MPPRIVFVDDEPRVLKGLRRRIGRDYDVSTAEGGAAALTLMRAGEVFEVVVSDMRMPGLSGAEFLARVRTEFPDTVRILLTGQADINDAIAAVNEGNIFRFLSKPCPPEILMRALSDAVEHYRLVRAERELLEGTVRGSVTLLTEILGIKEPAAASRGGRLKNHVGRLASQLDIDSSWDFEVAAMLSQIGYAVVPGDVVDRDRGGQALTDSEKQLLKSHPRIARELLAHIPRLESVAEMIGALAEVSTKPTDPRVALGVRLLTAAMEYDDRLRSGLAEGAAVAAMRRNGAVPDEAISSALERIAVESGGYIEKFLGVSDLVSGLILAADLYAVDGRWLLTEGTELSLAARTRIEQYSEHVGVREPVCVRIPI